MSVKLRLSRMGRKKRPYYRIVAVDSRRKRDGAFIDRVGYYHPLDTPATVNIEADKALKWLRDGAIPSQTVLSLFRREGVWLRFRLEKRGLPQTQIDTMMNEWFAAHKKEAVVPKKAAPKAAPAPAPAKAAADVQPVLTPEIEAVAAKESNPAVVAEAVAPVVAEVVAPIVAEAVAPVVEEAVAPVAEESPALATDEVAPDTDTKEG